MILTLKRTDKLKDCTLGELWINDSLFCYTCEDVDRGLQSYMLSSDIEKIKIKSETCIPYGKYKVTLDVKSPKYSNFERYKWAKAINGMVPRLMNVPGFTGVLIHIGNSAKDSDGCVLVGMAKSKNGVLRSTEAFNKLYAILKEHKEEGIEIEIV